MRFGRIGDVVDQPAERINLVHRIALRLRQNPHRGASKDMARGEDTDYPEPGENAEHTGEPEEDPEQNKAVQSSGERQKTNQNWRKEDPLAS